MPEPLNPYCEYDGEEKRFASEDKDPIVGYHKEIVELAGHTVSGNLGDCVIDYNPPPDMSISILYDGEEEEFDEYDDEFTYMISWVKKILEKLGVWVPPGNILKTFDSDYIEE